MFIRPSPGATSSDSDVHVIIICNLSSPTMRGGNRLLQRWSATKGPPPPLLMRHLRRPSPMGRLGPIATASVLARWSPLRQLAATTKRGPAANDVGMPHSFGRARHAGAIDPQMSQSTLRLYVAAQSRGVGRSASKSEVVREVAFWCTLAHARADWFQGEGRSVATIKAKTHTRKTIWLGRRAAPTSH